MKWGVLLLMIVTQALAQVPGTLCWNSLVPVKVSNSGAVSAEVLEFGSSVENSGINAEFLNRTDKVITGAVLLVELYDKNGTLIMTVPLVSGKGQDTLRFTGGPNSDGAWPPGQSLPFAAMAPYATAHCPLRAKVVVKELAFLDGTKAPLETRDWTMEAAVLHAGALRPDGIPKFPGQYVVSVDLGADGHVQSVDAEDSRLKAWFQSQLSKWTFFPKLKNGVPTPSTIQLLFRTHTGSHLANPGSFDKSVFNRFSFLVPVDVYLETGSPNYRQSIFVARQPFVLSQ